MREACVCGRVAVWLGVWPCVCVCGRVCVCAAIRCVPCAHFATWLALWTDAISKLMAAATVAQDDSNFGVAKAAKVVVEQLGKVCGVSRVVLACRAVASLPCHLANLCASPRGCYGAPDGRVVRGEGRNRDVGGRSEPADR